jgi:hypothetical protein
VVYSLPAQAQQKKPNIIAIMGDDVGWINVCLPPWNHVGQNAGCSPIITRRQAAPPVAPTSSLAKFLCALA